MHAVSQPPKKTSHTRRFSTGASNLTHHEPDPDSSSADVQLRPLEIQLRDGERYRGLLAFSNDQVLALEVEGHLLEVKRREVVSERYLDRDPSWGRSAGEVGERLVLERVRWAESSLLEVARATLGEGALAVFLPSRAPEAWKTRPDEVPEGGPFPLWEPSEEFPLECVPHLMTLGAEEDPLVLGLSQELAAEDWVFLESGARPLAVAGFLGQLRWAYVGERALGLRFYDPRVLRDLWVHLDSANFGLLFGGAWTRDAMGREDLRCVLCDAEIPALSQRCAGCGAPFLGEDVAPFLIGAQALVEGEELLVARPRTALGERRALARAPLPGRKALRLPPEVVRGLGDAYRARLEGGVGAKS